MNEEVLESLRARIDLHVVPFTDRGSRLLVFRDAQAPSLLVRLSERWPELDYIEGTYRQRPPYLRDVQLLDERGGVLPFTASARPDRLTLSTARGDVDVVFASPEVLAAALPPDVRGLRFAVHADEATIDHRGGTTRGVRNLAWTSNAPLRRNEVTAMGGRRWRVDVVAGDGDAMITLHVTAGRAFDRRVRPAAFRESASARWRAWMAQAPAVRDEDRAMTAYAWYVMGAGLVAPRGCLTRETLMPSKAHYVGTWAWDAYFHAIGYRHTAPDIAADQIRVIFDHQRPDGRVPDAVFDEGIVDWLGWPVEGRVTKPPLAGWAAWRVFEASRDADFLAEIYEPIVRAWRWWHAHADPDGDGLCQYDHPFSSGIDDSPLWDEGLPVVSPDLNTYLCVEAEALGRIADVLGLDERDGWRVAADDAAAAMRRTLYDERRGAFLACRTWLDGRLEPVRANTLLSLLPLWTGRMGAEIDDRLVAILTDPAQFWTARPLATVSRSDPAYDPNQMWRGPSWVNLNYMYVDALLRGGRVDLARRLCDETLAMVAGQPDIKEYYHSETGNAPPKAAPSFGWSAALAIDLAVRRARGEI